MNIGAYGFQGSSVFTITANYVGGHTVLVPGQPQSASTSLTNVCAQRNSVGACVGNDVETVQAGFFTFKLGKKQVTDSSHINFAFMPKCGENESGGVDDPGCLAGVALTAYLKVCLDAPDGSGVVNACTPSDKYGGHGMNLLRYPIATHPPPPPFFAGTRACRTTT